MGPAQPQPGHSIPQRNKIVVLQHSTLKRTSHRDVCISELVDAAPGNMTGTQSLPL